MRRMSDDLRMLQGAVTLRKIAQRIAKIITNEDGKLQYDLNEIEIYWLDKFEQLDDEQLSAVFVAWEIEYKDRWARMMMEEE